MVSTCARCGKPISFDGQSDWLHARDLSATCHGDPIEPRNT